MKKLDLCKKLAFIDLPKCHVVFHTADKDLDQLMARAEILAAENIKQFSPGMPALIEGGGYTPSVAAVPETSTWLMGLLALGAAGFMIRRNVRSAA